MSEATTPEQMFPAAYPQKQAKPIFIVRIQQLPDPVRTKIDETRKKVIEQTNGEYHVLVISTPFESGISFECYNSEKANDIDIDLLQERIIKILSDEPTEQTNP